MVSGAFTLDDEIQIHRRCLPGCLPCVTDSGERCWSASSIFSSTALRGLPSSGGAYAGISFTPVPDIGGVPPFRNVWAIRDSNP